MRAARYVGRIGGLAVALGVGAAALAGSAVASADTDTGSPEASSATDASPSPGAVASARVESSSNSESDPSPTATPSTNSQRHAFGDQADCPDDVTSLSGTSDRSLRSGARSRRAAPEFGESSPESAGESGMASSDGVTAERSTSAEALEETTAAPGAVSPSAGAAVRSDTPDPVLPVDDAVLEPVGVAGPSAGDGPTAPVDSPADWTLLAFARREIVSETGVFTSAAPTDVLTSAAPTPATALPFGLFANPITVDPVTPTMTDGIIHGSVSAVDSQGATLKYTVLSEGSQGGKVSLDEETGTFAFLPDYAVVGSGGTEQFSILVSELTWFASTLTGLPLVGSYFWDGLETLYQVPVVSTMLAPLIGHAVVQPVTVDVGALAPEGTPVAFTVKVASFDGTLISTNFFPAAGLVDGQTAPTIMSSPGLGAAGNTDPFSEWDESIPFVHLVPGVKTLREAGYNVVTWDPRGEYDSGGVLKLDSPFYEGRDVSTLIDWVTAQGRTTTVSGDPLIGMVGGSYGGAIQLVTAAIDHRVDAVVPGMTWNALDRTVYANGALKVMWMDVLLSYLFAAGAAVDPHVYASIVIGNLAGFILPSTQHIMAGSGPSALMDNVTAPTLLIQGVVDALFPLQEAVASAEALDANGVPVKMIYYCGGHGICLSLDDFAEQDKIIQDATLAWLDQYVKGDDSLPADDIPRFQWIDQAGDYYSSDLLPFEPGFSGDPITAHGGGGLLPIVPILGGSGPQFQGPTPEALILGAPAGIGVNLTVPAPSETETTQLVGTPELTFTYSGLGIANHVYAQLVDDQTGKVLGNLVTPVPVILDGGTHTVTVSMEDVAYTLPPGDTVTLQIFGSALQFVNLNWGAVTIADVTLTLPTVAPGVATPVPGKEEDVPAA